MLCAARIGFKGFCGSRSFGDLGACLPIPDLIADIPLPGPAMAETRAELVTALKPPKFDLTKEYLAGAFINITAACMSA